MKKFLLLFFALTIFHTVSAQDDNQAAATEGEFMDLDTYFIDHKTMMGERLIMISRKYLVDPDEIYKYNEVQSDKNGIVPGQILKIPLHESHKQNLDKFKEELIKKNGGNPVQVPAVPPLKKKPVEEEEEE